MRHIENKYQNGRNKATISMISLSIKGLNIPIKKRRLSDWIKKQDPMISCLEETHRDSKTKTG